MADEKLWISWFVMQRQICGIFLHKNAHKIKSTTPELTNQVDQNLEKQMIKDNTEHEPKVKQATETQPIKETKNEELLRKRREYHRNYWQRINQNPEKRAKMLQKMRDYQKKRREQMSDKQRESMNERKRQMTREKYKNMSPEEKAKKLERMSQNKKKKREESEEYRMKERERKRRYQQSLSAERKREDKRKWRATLSDEHLDRIRKRDREYQRKRKLGLKQNIFQSQQNNAN